MTAVTLSGAPLPGAVSLLAAAPIASTAPIAPGEPAPDGTDTPLVVDPEFRKRLDASIREGLADAKTFAREHTIGERDQVADWALLRMVWPPKTDDEDLAYLHQVEKTRTPAGTARARYWAKHGLTDEWEAKLKEYTSHAGPAQALAAEKLLHDALALVNTATQTGKAAAGRKRPFVVDESLTLAVDKPGNNPSYPSGHTSAAYAASIVLAALMPDRAKEFMDTAAEASWARIYGGVHFPTDVLAGAKMATTITSHLVRTSGITPIYGTAGGDADPAAPAKVVPRRRKRAAAAAAR